SFSTEFIDPYIDSTIPFVEDDSFVWSWGSNRSHPDFFQFSGHPRTFFYNANTTSIETIRDPNNNTLPVIAMSAGYSACAFSLSDSTIEGFLNPNSFFESLLRQYTIGEAYLFSLPFFNWTMTLLGDPLVSISFPGAASIDDVSIDEDEMWLNSTKDLARVAAQLYKKEQEAYEIVTNVLNLNDASWALQLLNPSNIMYSAYSESNRLSSISVVTSDLFGHPLNRYGYAFGFDVKSLDDFLVLKNYKISELL
ncbi:unnamed protein product, partial [marine sediment metagenome]